MKKYLIDGPQEKDRLNYQNKIDVYSLPQEMRFFRPDKNLCYLDAGCGNGNVIEALIQYGVNKIHGIDLSADRITEARKRFADFREIKLSVGYLDNTNFPADSFDRVLCRYIFEHVTNPQDILRELKRVLKPDGKIQIINLDDVFFGFYTKNEAFNAELLKLKQNLPQDFEIGRKLPQYLAAGGFQNIQWEAQTFFFQGERMELERENARMRIEQAAPLIAPLFASPQAFEQFRKNYLDEMKDANNVMWTTKYMVSATKTADGKLLQMKP